MPWLYDLYRKLPEKPKIRLKRLWFEVLSALDTGDDLLFMNHGYADPAAPTRGIDLRLEDESNRYAIQLYHRIAAEIDWKGLDVLEVSCGRGGGAAYAMRYLAPKSLVGMDITANAIRYCNKTHQLPGLSFEVGDAEEMKYADESFDAVLNVEACLHYKRLDLFFDESYRVLRPNGTLLLGDYRRSRLLHKLRARIDRSKFELVREEDMTSGVVAAMECDSDAKQALVDRHAPRAFRGLFSRFAGSPGEQDTEAEAFRTGERVYVRYVLRKPAAA